MMDIIVADLRSDTVTRPSAEMRKVIAAAAVGDDVLGDDPTVQELQDRAAQVLGKEAALYTPSGTMANQIAIRCHTEPGDEMICHKDSHAFYYESGAPSALSGVSLRFLDTPRGQFDGNDLRAVLRPQNAHFPPARLVVIENTHNRGGGSVWPLERAADVRRVATNANLTVHLDGARLMNACVAAGYTAPQFTQFADSVSMCFSKGLGAPIGSILAGSRKFIERARRFRKMFGGAMRQVGLIAAGALYALNNNIERLAIDHRNARTLAFALAELPNITIDPDSVETNILFFDLANDLPSAPDICNMLATRGVLMLAENARRVRAVTHLDVDHNQIQQAIPIIEDVLRSK